MKFENVNANPMVKGKKEMTNVKDVLPFIDAEINHQRHFIKTPFINKGMDFIDLACIFQDNLLLHLYLITSKILSNL